MNKNSVSVKLFLLAIFALNIQATNTCQPCKKIIPQTSQHIQRTFYSNIPPHTQLTNRNWRWIGSTIVVIGSTTCYLWKNALQQKFEENRFSIKRGMS